MQKQVNHDAVSVLDRTHADDRSDSIVEMDGGLWDHGVFGVGVFVVVADPISGDGVSGDWAELVIDLGGGLEFEAIDLVGDECWVSAGFVSGCDDGR
jgi:hypothetical protein